MSAQRASSSPSSRRAHSPTKSTCPFPSADGGPPTPSSGVPPLRNRRRAHCAMTRRGLIPVRAHLGYPFGSAYLSLREPFRRALPTWRYPFGPPVVLGPTRSAGSLDESPSQREDHRMG